MHEYSSPLYVLKSHNTNNILNIHYKNDLAVRPILATHYKSQAGQAGKSWHQKILWTFMTNIFLNGPFPASFCLYFRLFNS